MRRFIAGLLLTLWCASAHATIVYLNHATVSNGTSSSVNMTGANLIVVCVNWKNTGADTYTLSDSKSNSYTALTTYTPSAQTNNVTLNYVLNPTVGSMTFTISNTASEATIFVEGFLAASPSLDQSGGAGATTVTTIQPGSVTPSVDDELVVSCVNAGASGAAPTVSAGFMVTDSTNNSGSSSWAGGGAYEIQSSATAVNPTWTFSSANAAASIATFEATAICPATVACVAKENAYPVQIPGVDATVGSTKENAYAAQILGAVNSTADETKLNAYVVLEDCTYIPRPVLCAGQLFFQGVP